MNEDTLKMVKERFDALPSPVQEAILSSDYENSLIEIGKKYQLNVDQMGGLEQETTLVMMGLTPTDSFEEELIKELGIDKAKGDQIVTDINDQIFRNIRDILKIMNTPLGEEPSLEETPEIKKEEPVSTSESENHAILKSAGIEITPSISKDKEEENKKIIASISSQKLTGSFQVPATKTEYSLQNISKNSPGANTAVKAPTDQIVKTPLTGTIKPVSGATASVSPSYSIKEDPYRMNPE